MTTEGRRMPRFQDHLRVLSKAPDFAVLDVDGQVVQLSDFQGKKFVVLEFGSIT